MSVAAPVTDVRTRLPGHRAVGEPMLRDEAESNVDGDLDVFGEVGLCVCECGARHWYALRVWTIDPTTEDEVPCERDDARDAVEEVAWYLDCPAGRRGRYRRPPLTGPT